jgi:hypothetical protein
LKELINALKKSSQEMDPEVQAIVQRSHMKDGQKSTQSLYTAVDDLSTARETLDIAKLARHHLHIKWRNFLTDAVQRWQKHTEDFQQEEQALTQQIETAKAALAAAVKRFEDSKSELGVQVIDVEAQAAMEEASTDAAEGGTVGAALFDSLVTMRTQLETVQASAEAMVTEEATNSNKRQRLDEGFAASAPSSGGGVPSAVAPAMQPFAQREKQEHLGVAFCEARQVVTEVYSCQGLQQHPCILNWTHSACDESWFVTRWYAIESAYELAWQLGTPPTVLPQSSVWKSPVCGKRRNVRFSSDVELRFVQEEPIMTATLTILESQLQNWAEKPWSRHPVKTPSFSSCIERSVERVTPTKNVGFQFQERKPLQAIEDLPNLPSIALVQEPQSFKAVLIRTSCNIEKQASGEAQPFQFHRSDDFYNVPSRWYNQDAPHDQPNQQDQPDQEEDAGFFLHEAPDSVQLLFDALLQEGLIVGPRLSESVFVRSWHINHIHEHRCWHPRTLEINGHWRHWFADILSGWRDRNDPNLDTIFSIVHPNPPRTGSDREILYDIIISQGLEAPRNSGLITVLQKNDRAARARFSLAASLPYTTSGVQIVQSAEIIHECNQDTCQIRPDGREIPFSMAPTHDVQDGDSFLIAISSQAASSSSAPVQACQDDEPRRDLPSVGPHAPNQ